MGSGGVRQQPFDERALLSLDQERGTRARVSYLVNQPRTIGVTSRINIR